MTADDDAFGVVADASSATSGWLMCESFLALEPLYVTAINTDTGAATGTIEALPLYVFENSVP
jgi:hypothetical protein